MAYFNHDIGWKEAFRCYRETGRIEDKNKRPRSLNTMEEYCETQPEKVGITTTYPDGSQIKTYYPFIKLGNIADEPKKKKIIFGKKEEGTNPMYSNTCVSPAAVATIHTAESPETSQREYLFNRAKYVNSRIERDIRTAFNYYDPKDKPQTYKQLIDAIKNDKFTLDETLTKRVDRATSEDEDDEDYFDNFFHYTPFTGIKFTDFPGFDAKGYEAAKEALYKEYTKLQDTIKIMDPKDGLAALQKFEGWTYTKPTLQ